MAHIFHSINPNHILEHVSSRAMAHIFHSINPNHILEHVCMSNLRQARIIQTHTDYTETRNFGDWLRTALENGQ